MVRGGFVGSCDLVISPMLNKPGGKSLEVIDS